MPALLNVKSMMKNYVKLAPKHVENVQQPAENAVNENCCGIKNNIINCVFDRIGCMENVGYARASSPDQNFDAQIEALKTWL